MKKLGSVTVPTFNGDVNIEISTASSIVLIGANGAGKTRLGVHLDKTLPTQGVEVHRIGAHRTLNLNPKVIPPSLEIAQKDCSTEMKMATLTISTAIVFKASLKRLY